VPDTCNVAVNYGRHRRCVLLLFALSQSAVRATIERLKTASKQVATTCAMIYFTHSCGFHQFLLARAGTECAKDFQCNQGLCCSVYDLCSTSQQECNSYIYATPAPAPVEGVRNSGSSKGKVAAIAGGTCGGVIAVMAVIMLMWCRHKRGSATAAPPVKKSTVSSPNRWSPAT
jgi:hypothetical protein